MKAIRDLFGYEKPKRPRQKLMHVIDAGMADGLKHPQHIAQFECKCGYESDWLVVDSVTEAKRGLPCPVCNPNSGQ